MGEQCLPFPRGGTFNQLKVLAMDDVKFAAEEGRIYEVADTEHGTGKRVKLRVVKNDTGGDITVAKKLCRFSVNPGDFGRRIGTFPNDVAGGICKPLDDAYVDGLVIGKQDLFYVLEGGPCNVLTNGDTLALIAGDALASDAAGLISDDPAAAGEFVVGQSDITTVSATAITLLVHVNEGLAMPPKGT